MIGLHFGNGGFEIVGPEGEVHEGAGLDAFLGAEEDDAGVGSGDAEFEPALGVVEGLVGEDAEAEGVGVEVESPFLIGDGDGNEFDAANHVLIVGLCGEFGKGAVVIGTIVVIGMDHIAIDEYVLDVLMPDLVGHDRSAAALLVYLVIWTELYRKEERRVALSLQQIAERSGLSKSAVQAGMRVLKRRKLVEVVKATATAVPEYELVRHWVKRRAKSWER